VKLGGGKEWFTAAELAGLALPGIGSVKRRINEQAAAGQWALATDSRGAPLARPRQARGGGIEYHLSVLPAAARAALAGMGVAAGSDISEPAPATVAAMTATQLWRWFEGAGERVQADARRRLAIVQQVDAYEAAGMTRSAAVGAAARQHGVGSSTLWSYLGLIDGVAASDRLVHLAPRRQGGGSEAEISADAWQFLLSDYLRPEQPTFSACYWRLKKDFAAPRGMVLPTERTLRRKLEREVDGRVIIQTRQGAEALRRSIPAQERSVAELHAMEAVNIDGHKFDVFVRWPDGRIGRPMMVALQDVYSRKLIAHRIDESENALATRLVFADCFRDYGIPKHCLLDNGRAFASKTITGGAKSRFRFKIRDDEPTGVLTALGVEIHWATPYRGQSKPIERAFRDLCDTIAKHPALAGAYTGNKPDAKPENYGERAVDIDVFRTLVAAGIAAHNARDGRRSPVARGRSYNDVFAESYAQSPIGRATPEQVRMALLTAEERTCDRETGVVTLEGNRYWAPELAHHHGKKLTLRFDPDNLHDVVHVYDRTGAFICTAPVIAAVGFFDKAAAGQRRRQERDLRQLAKEKVKLLDLIDAASLAEMMPTYEDEVPAPTPQVVRPVRHRGQTAAALKTTAVAATAAPQPNRMIDRFAEATRRLRVVE
jgi:putative transposase